MSKETNLNVVNPMEIINGMIERFGRNYNSGIKDIYYNNPEVFPEGMSEDFLQEFDVLEMSAFVINSIANLFDNAVMTFIELDELTRTINQLRVINFIAEDCDDEDIKAEIGPYMIWAVNSMISEIDKIAKDHGNLKLMLKEAKKENDFNHTCSKIIEFNLDDSEEFVNNDSDAEDMEELEKKCSTDEDLIIAAAKEKQNAAKFIDKTDIKKNPFKYMILNKIGDRLNPDFYIFEGLNDMGRLACTNHPFEIPAVVNGKAILGISALIEDSIILPKSITELESQGIATYDDNITIYLPDNIKRIDRHAFIGKPCNIKYEDRTYFVRSDNAELLKSDFIMLKSHLEANGCKVDDHAFKWTGLIN